MCDLSRAEQGSLTTLLGDLQVRAWVTPSTTPPWPDLRHMKLRPSAGYPGGEPQSLARRSGGFRAGLAAPEGSPGLAGLEAPGRGAERRQHEQQERDDVHAGAV